MNYSRYRTCSPVLYLIFPDYPYLINQQVWLSPSAKQAQSCPFLISFTTNLSRWSHTPSPLAYCCSLWFATLLLVINAYSPFIYTVACLILKLTRYCHSLIMAYIRTTMNIGMIQGEIINVGKYTIYWNLSKFFRVLHNAKNLNILWDWLDNISP